MQRQPDCSFRFSPRDLIAFLEGDFAAWCERLRAEEMQIVHETPGDKRAARDSTFTFHPDEQNDEADLVIRRGFEHEHAHLARLRQSTEGLIEIAEGDSAHDETRIA